jgi:hypothetical protein
MGMRIEESITWRDLGDCFPASPDEGLDPPWTVDHDSGMRTDASLQMYCLREEATQCACFTSGHGRTHIWLEAWLRRDFIDLDDVMFLALVTHLWRFTCDCVREFWTDRRRGGKVLNRRSLARARRWASSFREDETGNWLRAEWSERIAPTPAIWSMLPGHHVEPPTQTWSTMPGALADWPRGEAAS